MTSLSALISLEEAAKRRIERFANGEIIEPRDDGLSSRIADIEAMAQIVEAALLATSHVSAVEAMLMSRTPHAENRLQHIAEAGCTSVANLVLATGSRK